MAREGKEIPRTGLVEYNGVRVQSHKLRRRKAERECEARKARNMTVESTTTTSGTAVTPPTVQSPVERDSSETPSVEKHTEVMTGLLDIDVIAKNISVSGLLATRILNRLS